MDRYRVKEVAKMLGVSRQRVWFYIKKGMLPGTLERDKYYITDKDLKKFLNKERKVGRPKK